MEQTTENTSIVMYGSPTCPMVPPMKGLLKQSNVPYEYINIAQNQQASERVKEINQGYASVPTFVFPDGSTLTEPSANEIRQKLEAMGYNVPWYALITGQLLTIIPAVIIVIMILRILGVF